MNKIEALKLRNPDALIRAIGVRLRDQRLAKGWTQKQLAERAGISVSTLKLMEHEGKGSLQRLAKVAGELRSLFADRSSYSSLDEVERTVRKRAPRRKNPPKESP